MSHKSVAPPQSHPHPMFLGNHSLGGVWMNRDSLDNGQPAMWVFTNQTTDLMTGLCTTDFTYTPGGPNGAYSYTYANDDNGREATALKLASRCDEIMGTYDPATSSQTGPDSTWGIIQCSGTIAGGVAEVRALKIFKAALSNAVILLEVYTRNASGVNTMLLGLNNECWSTV